MKKLTIEYIKEYCLNIGLQCISNEYISIKDNLEFICPLCGEHYFRNFDNIKNRNKILCNKCSIKERAKSQAYTYEEVKYFIEVESNSDCILLSDKYFNIDSKLKIKCSCGEIFETSFYKFKYNNKRQCNICGANITRNKNATPLSDILQLVKEANYKFIDNKLDGGDQFIKVQCDKNHEPYWVRISKFKMGQRCPHCDRSLGEEFIISELNKYNIEYQQEYIFPDLIGIGGGYLRYDFALFDKNKLIMLIEYDGLQHYEISFGSKDILIKTQKHDKIKNNYAKLNSIPLIRIPYFEYNNIPNIIEELINNYYKNVI
jgi:hypothetical protein